jgi:hypothetical protein
MRFALAIASSLTLSCALATPEPGPGRAVILYDRHVTVEYVDGERSSTYGGAAGVRTGTRSIGFVIEFPSQYQSSFPVILPTTCWVSADLQEESYRIVYSSRVDSSIENSSGPSVWLEDKEAGTVARAFCDNYVRKEIPTPCRVVSPVRMPLFNGNLNFPPSALLAGLSGAVELRLSLSRSGTVQRVSDVEVEPREFGSGTSFRRQTFAHWKIEPGSIVADRTDQVRVRCTFDHPSSA